jgi:hypothetical protein
LLQLLGLLSILQDKSVKVTLAADFELDLGGLLAALYAGSYFTLASLLADLPSLAKSLLRNPIFSNTFFRIFQGK